MNRYPSGRAPKPAGPPAKIQLPSAICVICAIFIGAAALFPFHQHPIASTEVYFVLVACLRDLRTGVLLIDLHMDAAILLSDDVSADDIADAYSYYRHMQRISDSLQPISLIVPALFALVFILLILQLLSTVLVRCFG
jgi:hypothetical protein